MSTETSDKNLPKWILTSRNFILIVIGILTAWNTYVSSVTSSKLEAEGKKLENLIMQREFENELRFKIFDEVKLAITDTDSNLQEVVKVMIEAVLVEDSAFQERMRTVLLASRNTATSVKKDIQNTEQYKQVQAELIQTSSMHQKSTSQSQGNLQGAIAKEKFRIDVFYLEDIVAESKPRAEQVVKLLQGSDFGFEVRLRLLPKSINARQGYRIDFNQIRYGKKEKSMAETIQELIESKGIFEHEQPKLLKVKTEADGYISVFVRNM
jgi:hypothetical protein